MRRFYMKKTIIFWLLILNVFSLISCDPSRYYYNYEWLNSNVKSIELINYENKDAIELFEQSDSVKPFDFSKMYVLQIGKQRIC